MINIILVNITITIIILIKINMTITIIILIKINMTIIITRWWVLCMRCLAPRLAPLEKLRLVDNMSIKMRIKMTRTRKSKRMIFLFLVAGALCKDGPEF